MSMKHYLICIFALATLTFIGCSSPKAPEQFAKQNSQPKIYPDYIDVTIPSNIAPTNFMVLEKGEEAVAKFSYPGGEATYGKGMKIQETKKKWKEMLQAAKGKDIKVEVFVKEGNGWKGFQAFSIFVAEEEIDPYISYRLIYPSYIAYEVLSINQRNITNFEEKDIYNNMIISSEENGQCINCHSYQNYHTTNMQFHMRQGHGGTMIVEGDKLTKVDLKSDSTISSGVYPSWHPTQKLIAYSTNSTGQSFHTMSKAKIEVQDSKSDIILYDVEKNEVTNISNIPDELEVYPYWAPTGDMLYYCSAHFEFTDTTGTKDAELIRRYKEVKYNIYRKTFDQKTHQFGPTEMVYQADSLNASATLPRISPDGRYLLFAQGEFGCFHIWHPDADLHILDLKTGEARKLENVNSNQAESYHSWSSNGRWIIFSSRRDDGNYTRLYIAYFDKEGKAHKAFALPQKDPGFYTYFLKSYNIPEFMVEPVKHTPQEFASAAKKDVVHAKFNGQVVSNEADTVKHLVN